MLTLEYLPDRILNLVHTKIKALDFPPLANLIIIETSYFQVLNLSCKTVVCSLTYQWWEDTPLILKHYEPRAFPSELVVQHFPADCCIQRCLVSSEDGRAS